MNNTIEFEVRLPAGADIELIEATLRAELSKLAESRQVQVQHSQALGMTGPDIAIGFVISFAASVIASRYRDEIDAILDKTASTTKTVFKTIFKEED